MAIYHCSIKIGSRANGSNSVAAAAYRHATKLFDEQEKRMMNYSQKLGVVHSEILTPKGAPKWAQDREKLWNEVERKESRINSQLYREAEVALPVELSKGQQIDLVRKWAQEQFVDQGMVADIAIHHDHPENPHAHIMLTMRDLGPDGWAKNKNRDWNRKSQLLEWRESWAREVNLVLKRHGHDVSIDHRSHADRGLEVVPGVKQGRVGERIAQERAEAHSRVLRDNGEYLRENPNEVLSLLAAEGRAVWTQRDIDRVIHRHTLDDEQFQSVRAAVSQSPQLVHLEGERFTSAAVLDAEQRMLECARRLHAKALHAVALGESDPRLNADQRAAVRALCGGGDLQIIEGAPGTGKSFMLRGAVEAWHDKGYRVIAGGVQSFQVAGFARDAGITEAGSLARWLTLWEHEQQCLDASTVMVIDEAGMVGTEQMQRVLEEVERAGAKLILVGDRHQLPPIQHGSPFRLLADELGAAELRQIVRQREGWHREAIESIREGREKQGYEALKAHGCIEEKSRDDAFRGMIKEWREARDEGKSAALLAYQRKDVFQLNQLAREQLRAELSGPAVSVNTPDGTIELQRGDEIMLRQNDRQMEVKNGEVGRVARVEDERIFVRMQHGKDVVVELRDYRDEEGQVPLQLAHAFTGHKSQGATCDTAFVYSDSLANREWLHVAVSRPRHEVRVYAEDAQALERAFSKSSQKEMASDFKRVERPQQPIDIQDERGRAKVREAYKDFSDAQLEGVERYLERHKDNYHAPLVADVVREMREEIAQKQELKHDGAKVIREAGSREESGRSRSGAREGQGGYALGHGEGRREDEGRGRGSRGDPAVRREIDSSRDAANARGLGRPRPRSVSGVDIAGEAHRGHAGRATMAARRVGDDLDRGPLGRTSLGPFAGPDVRGGGPRGVAGDGEGFGLDQSGGGPGEHGLRGGDHQRDGVSQGPAGQAHGEVGPRGRAAAGEEGLGVCSGTEDQEGREVGHERGLTGSDRASQGRDTGGAQARPYRPGEGFEGQFRRLADSARQHGERTRRHNDSVAQADARNRDRANECSETLGSLEQQRQGLERGIEQVQQQIRELDRQMQRGRGLGW